MQVLGNLPPFPVNLVKVYRYGVDLRLAQLFSGAGQFTVSSKLAAGQTLHAGVRLAC